MLDCTLIVLVPTIGAGYETLVRDFMIELWDATFFNKFFFLVLGPQRLFSPGKFKRCARATS